MRIFWRSLGIVGGLVLLLLIGVAVAVWTVDVNDFVGPLQRRVKESTGRDLVIRGGIGFKVSLEPKLVINDVSLGNSPWGRSAQMLVANRVEAQVALLPLLQRRFEIERFTLVGPVIALETDADGRGNWEFGAADATRAKDGAAPSNALATLSVGDVAVSEGDLTYRDGKTGKLTHVTIDELSIHARDARSPVSARFRGKIDDLSVAFEGDLGPLEQLAQRRWPYPVALKGEVNGRKASLSAKARIAGGSVGLDSLEIGAGSSTLIGELTVSRNGSRSKVSFKLSAGNLALADLALAGGAVPVTSQLSELARAKSRYLFKEDVLHFAGMTGFDADGELAIDKLALPEGRHVDQVHAQINLDDGHLKVDITQAKAFGGIVQARFNVDASRAQDPALEAHVDAKDMDLAQVLAAAGVHREMRGGKARLLLDIESRGVSPRQWASGVTGSVLAVAGPATLVNAKSAPKEPLNELARAINPFHDIDAATDLQCAVVRLPFRNGMAQADRSIAFETSKLGATASGTIDLRNETIDLSMRPQLRQGIRLDVAQIAQLVRFRGPLTSPSVGIDAVGSAETVARIGAAVGTGGWSLLGEALLSGTHADRSSPCQVALGRSAARDAKAANDSSPPPESKVPLVNDVGKALDRLFRR